MEFAIGIGGTIMKNKRGLARTGLPHLLIKIHVLPLLEPRRLALGQICLHREVCLGKVECVFVIAHKRLYFRAQRAQ